MSEYSYIKLNRYMHAHSKLAKAAVILCKLITLAVYVFYPAFLIYLFFNERQPFLKSVLVPLVSVILVSLMRLKMNLPRPYEIMNMTPLYDKKTKGQSFPSRHTFAIFIIAFTVYFVKPIIGIALSILGLMLAALRVIIGVHYVRDVLAGFLCAVISAVIGYIII